MNVLIKKFNLFYKNRPRGTFLYREVFYENQKFIFRSGCIFYVYINFVSNSI